MSAAPGHRSDGLVVSFVIPQKGRLDLLERTLRSIASQRLDDSSTEPAPRLEVIVVTQESDPEPVGHLMRDVLDGIDFDRLVVHEAVTISALRNRGARAARGELLAFLDADIELSDNWTRALTAELFEDETRVLASAVQVAPEHPTDIERIQVEMSRRKADGEVDFLSGHNLLVHRRVFDAAGGFPEHLQTCEDYVFADRVNALGTLFLSSRATYVHLGEDRDHGVMFGKERWRGRSNFASLAGRRIGVAELPSFVVPPVVALALGALPIALLLGHGSLAVALLLLAALPVLAYTARLLLASRGRLGLFEVLAYYLTYFPARGIGMLLGVVDLLPAGRRPR